MSKNVKKGIEPRLRFPEFKKAGEWGVDLLGSYSEVVRGGSPRPIDAFLTKSHTGLNWLKIGDVDKEAKYVYRTEEKVIKEALSKTRVVKPDDLIMSNSMSFGRPYIMKIDACIHDGWIAITEINKKLDRDFLYYLISSEGSQRFFNVNSAGSGVKNLNVEIIKKLPLVYSEDKKEQQKIAECLSSLDEVITAQGEKVEVLKTYKTGLLQQLFPQEGQTTPTLRFPEFKKSGDWGSLTLGELVDFSSGGTPSKDRLEYWSGTIPWISASSMYDIRIKSSELNVSQSAIGNGTRLARAGTLLILVRGSMLFNRVPICILEVDATFNQDVKALKTKDKISPEFLLYHLLSCEHKIPIDKTGIGAGKIDTDDLKKVSIFIPADKKEQQKIVNYLSSFEELITAESERLARLKDQKKGLLQQLFPKIKSGE